MKNDNDGPYYIIKNIKRIAKHMGRDIAKSRKIKLEEFSNYIKPREIVSIIKQFAHKKNDKYYMNTKILEKVLNEIHNWVLGVTLSKLASNDMIETYWDSNLNCMTFSPKIKE